MQNKHIYIKKIYKINKVESSLCEKNATLHSKNIPYANNPVLIQIKENKTNDDKVIRNIKTYQNIFQL